MNVDNVDDVDNIQPNRINRSTNKHFYNFYDFSNLRAQTHDCFGYSLPIDKHFEPSFGSIRARMAELEQFKILIKYNILACKAYETYVFYDAY